MANGIPVRLSVDLAQRARSAAETSDRSVTEQVEHWARLGQAVEDVVLAKTVARLKARSHDPDLATRIALADTPDGRAKALALINGRNPVRHGTAARGQLHVVRDEAAADPAPRTPTRTLARAPSRPPARTPASAPARAPARGKMPAPLPISEEPRSKTSARPPASKKRTR